MHWRFDPLFSISVYHNRYKNPDPQTGALPQAPDFLLEPSNDTRKRLQKMGWVFRPTGWGWTALGEKTYSDDGSAVLRAKPGAGEGFTFLLRLRNTGLFNETKPYMVRIDGTVKPNPTLPSFSGRARLLYFDNLNPVGMPPPAPANHFWLSAGPADVEQLASRAPTPFPFATPKPGVTGVDVTPLAPAGATKTYPLNPSSHSVVLDLPENGYRIVQQPVNQSEILFLTSEIPPADAIGIVRIFEHPGSGGWEPHRCYQILFGQV